MPDLDERIAQAGRGEADAVLAAVEAEPELASATNMFGVGVIHAAHHAGHAGLTERLLAARGDLDAVLAAELGFVERLRALLDTHPELATAHNDRGSTALHGAAYWGQIAAARLLLERGADPNAPSRDGFLEISAIGAAVATPNIPNPSDDEPNVVELVTLLLEHGADVNFRRRDGMTALHTAAYRGHAKVARLLLERDADSSIAARDDTPHAGETPADTADAQGHTEVATLIREYP